MFVSESDSDTKLPLFDDDADDYGNVDDPNGSSGPRSTRKTKKKKKSIGDLIANAKKHISHRHPTRYSKRRSSFSPPPPPSVSGNNRAVGTNSCFRFKPLCSLRSSAESNTSDPNHPDFTVDMLKTLIQTNEFYSSECNPHL